MTGARASCEETQSRARNVKASRKQGLLALPSPRGRDGKPRAGGPQLSAVQPPPPTLGHDPLLSPIGKGSLKGQEVLQVANSHLLISGPGRCPKAGARKPHPLLLLPSQPHWGCGTGSLAAMLSRPGDQLSRDVEKGEDWRSCPPPSPSSCGNNSVVTSFSSLWILRRRLRASPQQTLGCPESLV